MRTNQITFDGSQYTLTFDGNAYTAHNNVASNSNGKWLNGAYKFDKIISKANETEENKRRFGPIANVVFDYPGRTGMGIHSGRTGEKDGKGREGTEYCTMGCIRTTDEAVTDLVKFIEACGEDQSKVTLKVENN